MPFPCISVFRIVLQGKGGGAIPLTPDLSPPLDINIYIRRERLSGIFILPFFFIRLRASVGEFLSGDVGPGGAALNFVHGQWVMSRWARGRHLILSVIPFLPLVPEILFSLGGFRGLLCCEFTPCKGTPSLFDRAE